MSEHDGGPAFPIPDERDPVTGAGIIQGSSGMTLRDWFATHAPEPTQEYIELECRLDIARNPHGDYHKPKRRSILEIKAQFKFEYADAMLAARAAAKGSQP